MILWILYQSGGLHTPPELALLSSLSSLPPPPPASSGETLQMRWITNCSVRSWDPLFPSAVAPPAPSSSGAQHWRCWPGGGRLCERPRELPGYWSLRSDDGSHWGEREREKGDVRREGRGEEREGRREVWEGRRKKGSCKGNSHYPHQLRLHSQICAPQTASLKWIYARAHTHLQDEEEGESSDPEVSLSTAILQPPVDLSIQCHTRHINLTSILVDNPDCICVCVCVHEIIGINADVRLFLTIYGHICIWYI